MNTEVSETSSCVPSYHIYKQVWDVVIGKELQCEREREAIDMQSPLKMGLSPVICRVNITNLYVPFS